MDESSGARPVTNLRPEDMPPPAGVPRPSLRRDDANLIRDVALVGAALCVYAPGSGNPALWPTSRCDCKFGASGRGEQTGCPEARAIYRMLTGS